MPAVECAMSTTGCAYRQELPTMFSQAAVVIMTSRRVEHLRRRSGCKLLDLLQKLVRFQHIHVSFKTLDTNERLSIFALGFNVKCTKPL
mmetsp:Transcript_168/g.219  ORF Transcript_168/g.219 Transcript_168/m.219 type:complete len:89 (-) Transcript_168:881-1147(-)